MPDLFDVAIVGSGIAGSTLALILSRCGFRVLVIEKGRHPRFVIGESTVPTTTLTMRQLARTYQVPEIEEVSHYLGLKQRGLTAFPKRVFWFGVHRAGRELEPRDEVVLDTFPLPIGPDVHMLRADSDEFLASRFPHYGVDYLDNTTVVDHQREGNRSRILTRTQDGDQAVSARFVIDASGHASCLANLYNLREDPPRFDTNTRSLFGHFRGVQPLDSALHNRAHPFRFQRDSGTLQHCFDGGWMWVIPFDDGVTSVGLVLDCNQYPLDPHQTPEDELWDIINRYPSIRSHLGQMWPIRPLVRTPRVQFSSRTIAGDGFILTPHAAAFIDPLFSTGMLLTMTFISRLVPVVEAALHDDDFRAQRFLPLERAFFREVELVDLTVSGMIASMRDAELFRQYWRIWVHASGMQYFAKAALPPEKTTAFPLVYGAGIDSWVEAVRAMHRIVMDRDLPTEKAVLQTKAVMDNVPHPFLRRRYSPNSDQPLYIHTQMDKLRILRWLIRFLAQPELRKFGRTRGLLASLFDALGYGPAQIRLAIRYLQSRRNGGRYHDLVNDILKLNAGSGERLAPTESPQPTATTASEHRLDDPSHPAPHQQLWETARNRAEAALTPSDAHRG